MMKEVNKRTKSHNMKRKYKTTHTHTHIHRKREHHAVKIKLKLRKTHKYNNKYTVFSGPVSFS